MNFFSLAFSILIPSLSIMLICTLMSLSEIYQDDWYLEDDEESTSTSKAELTHFFWKCGLVGCCISLYIFALDSYDKGFYFITVLLILSPIWIFWQKK